MMQIQFIQILKVIFVLSTIVSVTDCCSSRILLLREHTLKIVEHQDNFHNHLHEHAHQLQQQIERRVVDMVNQMEMQQKLLAQQQLLELGEQQQSEGGGTEEPLLDWQDLGEAALSETTTEQPITIESTETWAVGGETTTAATGEPPPSIEQIISTPSSPMESSTEANSNTDTSLPPAGGKTKVQDSFNYVREVLPCSDSYKSDFCLNGGRCFRFPLANHSFYSCECADGYVGERCESKTLNEQYVIAPPAQELQPKIGMARIVLSFPMLILLSTIYVAFGAVFMFRSVPKQRSEQNQLRLHKQRFFVSC
ncbi:protein gurken [Scaptodrosophila lebanonensis]|uniref:Protein gurken n=1 Tax=Drosophila lebanonensis TaxID=7225 RepID=A0A6J2TLV6_DROLE|nr:protein gurken [Scaptodrosophila lebanonensis]